MGTGRHLRSTVLLATDQAVSSLSNIMLPLLIAGSVSPADYGYFLTAYAALALLLSISRGTIAVPVSLASASKEALRRESGLAVTSCLLAGPLVVGLLVAVPLLAGSPWTPLYLLFGAGGLLTLIQDNLRYAGVANGRLGRVLLSDLLWLGVMSLSIPVRLSASGTVAPILVAWLAGASLAIALLLPGSVAKCGVRSVLHAWSTDLRSKLSLVVAAVGSAGSVMFAGILITRLAGPTVNGALGGAGQLMTPVNLLVALIGIGLLPMAARHSPVWSRRAFALTGGALTIGAVLWGGLILLAPYDLGTALLGDTWLSARSVILPVAVATGAAALGAAGTAHMMRISNEDALARLRLCQGGLRIASVLLVAELWGTALSLACTEVMLTTVFAIAVWRAIRNKAVLASPHGSKAM